MKKQFIIEAQRLQKLAGITEAKITPQSLVNSDLFADFSGNSSRRRPVDRFARTIAELLEILSENRDLNKNPEFTDVHIDDVFGYEGMDDIEDGNEFYAGPNESLEIFQSLPKSFKVSHNIDSDNNIMSWEITKTGFGSFNANAILNTNEAKITSAGMSNLYKDNSWKGNNKEWTIEFNENPTNPDEKLVIIDDENVRDATTITKREFWSKYITPKYRAPIPVYADKEVELNVWNFTYHKADTDGELEVIGFKENSDFRFVKRINEAKITPQSLVGGLTRDQLLDNIVAYDDEDPQFYQEIGFNSKEEIRNYYNRSETSDLVELIASSQTMYPILRDFYNKHKRIIIDNKDYTDLYLQSVEMYGHMELEENINANEAKITPQGIFKQEETPEGWEEEKGDIGEYWNGNIIVREYYRDDIHLDEYHTVYIFKRPNGEYYVDIKTSDQYKYQSDPFDSFNKAKEYAFNEMYIIIDKENEGYYDDDDPDDARYDEYDDD